MGRIENNLLVRLGITRKEDIISNILADLLLESSFLDRWLEYAGLPLTQGRDFVVKTRINADGNIPDLAVRVGHGMDCSLLVIENKVLATEGVAQTERYSNLETVRLIGDAFGIKDLTQDQFKGLYLSLHDEGPKDKFLAIQYGSIVAWLREIVINSPDSTRQLMAADLAELIEFFHTEDWSRDSLLQDVLRHDPCGLGKNFVAFQRIFQEGLKDLPKTETGISRDSYFWRGSGHGHSYFGGVLETDCSKSGWYLTLDESTETKLWSVAKIQFHYEHQAKRVKLVVHYESSPYSPKKLQDDLFKGREHCLAIHQLNRKSIVGYLKTHIPDGWMLANNYLQIAYAKLDVTPETTVVDFQKKVRVLVNFMIPVLDNALKEARA